MARNFKSCFQKISKTFKWSDKPFNVFNGFVLASNCFYFHVYSKYFEHQKSKAISETVLYCFAYNYPDWVHQVRMVDDRGVRKP